MRKNFIRKLAAIGAVGMGAYFLFFRSWQRRWGATDEEVQRALSGDELGPNAGSSSH